MIWRVLETISPYYDSANLSRDSSFTFIISYQIKLTINNSNKPKKKNKMAIHRNTVSTKSVAHKPMMTRLSETMHRTNKPTQPPMMTRMKNSLHRSEAKVSSKVHKPMMSRTKLHSEVKPTHHGLRHHRMNKKHATLPKQNVGIIGRLRLMINRLMNFTKVNTNKMITAAPRPVVHHRQPKHL